MDIPVGHAGPVLVLHFSTGKERKLVTVLKERIGTYTKSIDSIAFAGGFARNVKERITFNHVCMNFLRGSSGTWRNVLKHNVY